MHFCEVVACWIQVRLRRNPDMLKKRRHFAFVPTADIGLLLDHLVGSGEDTQVSNKPMRSSMAETGSDAPAGFMTTACPRKAQ